MVNLNSEKLTFLREQNNLLRTQTDLRKNTGDMSKELRNYFSFRNEENYEV